jgi:hypothetical protein
MNLKRITLALLAGAALVLLPSTAGAQPGPSHSDTPDVLVRIHGDVHLGPDESADVVVVVNANAVIEGTVRQVLVVVHGTATVSGTVGQEMVLVKSTGDLQPTARINGEVILAGPSTLNQAAGAVVAGEIVRRENFNVDLPFGFFSSFIFWLAITVFTLSAGLLFAGVAGRQLSEAGATITSTIGGSMLGVLTVFIALPLLAVLAMMTVVGIPLGVAALLLVPALGFLGYLVVGTRLGTLVLRVLGITADPDHPYLPALLGLLVLRLFALVPFVGFLAAFLAGVLGAGALAVLAWRALRSPTAGALEPLPI